MIDMMLVEKGIFFLNLDTKSNKNTLIDSSTIDGNVEFVHSQYSCILTSSVSTQFLCPTKLLIMVV